MDIKLTKYEAQTIRRALDSAIENEKSFVDAYTCKYCYGTKILNGRPCHCKTGVIRGSMELVREREKLITNMIKVAQKFVD